MRTYTFVFDKVYDNGEHTMLVMPDAPHWLHTPYTSGPYDPDGKNEHLGERTTLQAIGEVMLTRLITRLGY